MPSSVRENSQAKVNAPMRHRLAVDIQKIALLALLITGICIGILAYCNGGNYFISHDGIPFTVIAATIITAAFVAIILSGLVRMRATRIMQMKESSQEKPSGPPVVLRHPDMHERASSPPAAPPDPSNAPFFAGDSAAIEDVPSIDPGEAGVTLTRPPTPEPSLAPPEERVDEVAPRITILSSPMPEKPREPQIVVFHSPEQAASGSEPIASSHSEVIVVPMTASPPASASAPSFSEEIVIPVSVSPPAIEESAPVPSPLEEVVVPVTSFPPKSDPEPVPVPSQMGSLSLSPLDNVVAPDKGTIAYPPPLRRQSEVLVFNKEKGHLPPTDDPEVLKAQVHRLVASIGKFLGKLIEVENDLYDKAGGEKPRTRIAGKLEKLNAAMGHIHKLADEIMHPKFFIQNELATLPLDDENIKFLLYRYIQACNFGWQSAQKMAFEEYSLAHDSFNRLRTLHKGLEATLRDANKEPSKFLPIFIKLYHEFSLARLKEEGLGKEEEIAIKRHIYNTIFGLLSTNVLFLSTDDKVRKAIKSVVSKLKDKVDFAKEAGVLLGALIEALPAKDFEEITNPFSSQIIAWTEENLAKLLDMALRKMKAYVPRLAEFREGRIDLFERGVIAQQHIHHVEGIEGANLQLAKAILKKESELSKKQGVSLVMIPKEEVMRYVDKEKTFDLQRFYQESTHPVVVNFKKYLAEAGLAPLDSYFKNNKKFYEIADSHYAVALPFASHFNVYDSSKLKTNVGRLTTAFNNGLDGIVLSIAKEIIAACVDSGFENLDKAIPGFVDSIAKTLWYSVFPNRWVKKPEDYMSQHLDTVIAPLVKLLDVIPIAAPHGIPYILEAMNGPPSLEKGDIDFGILGATRVLTKMA